MEAIASSSNVEDFLLKLFMQRFGGGASIAAKIYLALDVDRAKTQALAAAVDTLQDDKLKSLINAVIKLARTNTKIRNSLAHDVWGISPQLPNALLLVDPKATLTDELDRNEIYVWTEQDFRSLIAANDRVCGYGLKLKWILQGHVANREGRLFDELYNQPEIQERLDRRA